MREQTGSEYRKACTFIILYFLFIDFASAIYLYI